MNIHEYQAKELLRHYGLPVNPGYIVNLEDDIHEKTKNLEQKKYAVKAQIHAGGRGKGGGVKLATGPQEVTQALESILGMCLVTPQTPPEGKKVHKAYVEEACAIQKEFYLSFLLDKSLECVQIIASAEGGVNIEELAKQDPTKIKTLSVNPLVGLQPFQVRELFYFLALPKEVGKSFQALIEGCYKVFTAKEMELLEVNPLVLTADNELLVLDAKMSFEDNALARHKDIAALKDPLEYESSEVEAAQYDLNFIKLDGNIGCMVNGAGLAMSTMDILKYYGGSPANFLDVGGGATAERVTAAFRLILADSNVRAVFVNIFGGIIRCDLIAEGILKALENVKLTVPLVVRLQGTNVELGSKMLEESPYDIVSISDFSQAAKVAVEEARK